MTGAVASTAFASDVTKKAQGLVDQISPSLFEAAGIAPELRFPITVIEGDRPIAMMVGERHGEISTDVFVLADFPEEVAAALARIIAEKQAGRPALANRKGYKFSTRAPGRDTLRGSITSVDEAVAQSSERAAFDTLKSKSGFGPPVEEIRATARNLDGLAVELLRKVGTTGVPLMTLYEAMAISGAGLFERNDYEGRQILREQIGWLRERVSNDEDGGRAPRWMAMDTDLNAIKEGLESEM
ncbi:hypothetical protein [Iodidimonas muriae]|uniref:hypothetical protein n=1 Tax=Iodidimonas muriae TaxID=261467 RepID=UPI00166E13CF|nr:hypothetical protein [Iodidimonas muriae]